ncbi:MAG: adenylate/guanylate cyclase domain-containing protein [Candidatus Zixiibacteriota bacterium]|nr:MAG: adenylate/guanylate cyclase domain-containing protein [candidate division Zixibacteria bacterium]
MDDRDHGNGFLSSIRKHGSMGIAILCWLLALAIGFVFHEPFLDLENSLFDLRMRLPHRVKAGDNIVYVDIDDRSMTLLGRWPWPRSQIAEIVRTLNQADIWGMFVDVIFSEETTAAEDLALTQELEQIENLFLGIGARLLKPDERSPQGQSPSPILTSFCYDFKMEGGGRALRVGRTLTPMPSLLALGTGLGHISFVPDDDGVARHIPLLVDLNGRGFPSIDVEIARRILDVGQEEVRIVPGHRVVMAGARLPGLTERVDVRIPVDSQMRMLINYAGPWGKAFKHYPLHSVLRSLLSENDAERRKAETLLEGNLIILSAAYSGSTDMGPTPLEPLAPLSEIHAHAISSIVNQRFLKRVPITVTMLIVLPICVLLGFLSPKCHTLHFSGLSAAVAVLWIAAAFVLFSMAGLVVDIVWPGAAILLSYGGCAGYIHWKTERERASLRSAFSNYVSPDVLSQILKDPGMLMLGGERVDLSILVFILENFEQFCENAEPEEIIELLTSIYEDACEAILSHGGTVDKFTKDGLIAFFGAPIRQEDHPQSAAMAALSIRQTIMDLAVSRSKRGQKTVGAKMAVNTGFATVGNIGSSKRMDYTVIGRTVNLCIRIAQSAAEGQIAVTRKTYQKMGDLFKAEECGEIRISTHSKPFFHPQHRRLGRCSRECPGSAIKPTDGNGRQEVPGPLHLD